MIGDTLKRLRLRAGLTQEQVAERLGVTPPAVNKWENNRTMPDITLLAPLARLLGATTDELLSFQRSMTAEEIEGYIREASERLEKEPFGKVFSDAESKLLLHPNETRLMWGLAAVLTARLEKEDEAAALPALMSWCREAMRDEKEEGAAARQLFYLCLRAENYEEAMEAAARLPDGHPERKQMEADIYRKTGRWEEAYRTCEELMLISYTQAAQALNSLKIWALEDGDGDAARRYALAACRAAGAFDMGRFQEVSPMLDVALQLKDKALTLETAAAMLKYADTVRGFVLSPLYGHLKKKPSDGAVERGLANALAQMADDPAFDFMKDTPGWETLREKMKEGRSGI